MNVVPSNPLPANLKPGLVCLGWLCLATATRSLAPWFFWLTLAGIPGWALYHGFKTLFDAQTRRFLSLVTIFALAAHITWAVIRSFYYNPSLPTYWRDDHQYFTEVQSIVTAWKSGFYPDISLKGSLPYLGTLHTGYHRILSAVLYFTGIHVLPGLILNAVCASLMPVLAAFTVVMLIPENTKSKHGEKYNLASTAALFTVLHPTQFYWASYLLKDTFTAFTFFGTLVMVLQTIRHRDLISAVAALALVPFLFTVRAYASLSLIAGCGSLALLYIPRKVLYQWGPLLLGLILIILAYTPTGIRLWEQIRDSFVNLLPVAARGSGSLLLHIITGVPRLFLSPYAWMYVDKPSPMYGMYPGMVYLYLLVYPWGFAGISWVIARNIRISVIPLIVFGFAAMLFLASDFAGAASRQRFFLECLMIPFAAIGFKNPNRWITGIFIAEISFMIGQIISLY